MFKLRDTNQLCKEGGGGNSANINLYDRKVFWGTLQLLNEIVLKESEALTAGLHGKKHIVIIKNKYFKDSCAPGLPLAVHILAWE